MVAAFFINLDRDHDRRLFMEGQFAALTLQVTRISAVYGKDVPVDLEPYFHRESIMTPGEVGCYASHIVVWKRIVALDMSHALVLEDDAQLSPDILRTIDETLAALPDGWDFVHMSRSPQHAVRPLTTLACRRTLVRYSVVPLWTLGYLISAAGARKLLCPRPRNWPVDWDTRRPWEFGLDTYGLVEPPVGRRQFQSTIASQGGRSRRGMRRGVQAWASHPMRSRAAFLFNLRKLGPAWWLRCAANNAMAKLFGRKPIITPVE